MVVLSTSIVRFNVSGMPNFFPLLKRYSEPCHQHDLEYHHTMGKNYFRKNAIQHLHALHLSQILKLNFGSCWCFDICYHHTFFMQHNDSMDLIYMLVQFKLKHQVSIVGKMDRVDFFFTVCGLNETFRFMFKFSVEACPQMKYELVV